MTKPKQQKTFSTPTESENSEENTYVYFGQKINLELVGNEWNYSINGKYYFYTFDQRYQAKKRC